jgi:hypothetical protein
LAGNTWAFLTLVEYWYLAGNTWAFLTLVKYIGQILVMADNTWGTGLLFWYLTRTDQYLTSVRTFGLHLNSVTLLTTPPESFAQYLTSTCFKQFLISVTMSASQPESSSADPGSPRARRLTSI